MKCVWCKKETTKAYPIGNNYNTFLCGECAIKHANSVKIKLQQKKQELDNRIKKLSDRAIKLKQKECNHENLKDTGYCKNFGYGHMKQIYVCENCNKTIYR